MKISVVLMLCIMALYLLTKPLNSIRLTRRKLDNKTLFLFFSCILLFLIAAFRGDFATDYPIYHWQFLDYRDSPWSRIIEVRDIGFFLWCKLLFLFTDNILFGFVSMALVMMLMYYKLIKENSCLYLLSLILLVGIDNYIVSFNLMRYILVVSIFMNLSKYIVTKDWKKYLLGVVLLSTLHRAAIVMIPFYWLLSIDYRKRKNVLILLGGITGFTVLLLFTKQIAVFLQAVIGMEYNTNSGLDYGSIGSALKSGLFLLFIFACHRRFDYSNRKERIWINGCCFAVMFHVLAIKVLMLHRFAYLVSGFFILMIPLVTSRMPKKTGKLVNVGMILFVLAYCQFVQNVEAYYPFWQNALIQY